MSVYRDAMRELVFECNHCGEELETEETEFGGALNHLDIHSWRAVRDKFSGDWEHFCPECVRDFEPVE